MLRQRIQYESDILSFIAAQPAMMAIVRAVEALRLPDCWIGAGFVRNAVWDALHDRPWSSSHGDVDVVYFDPVDVIPDRDAQIEKTLKEAFPDVPWSVRNQARMHARNGDLPYTCTADACRHWPETCTAVAVRSNGAPVELLAPFGIGDLVSLTVRPTPAFERKMDVYRARIAEKRWAERWPRLRIHGLEDQTP